MTKREKINDEEYEKLQEENELHGEDYSRIINQVHNDKEMDRMNLNDFKYNW